ncbi:MAG: PDZ domain-containing protein [Pirellulales bacterium]|nr:PDZ domain-containing protein [Pirellulales bacterium]
MLRKVAIIAAGLAVLFGSIALTKGKDDKADSRVTEKVAATGEDTGKSAAESISGEKTSKQADRYWLGLRCVAPLPEMIRAQVDLPAGGGIYVAKVVPKGPAAEAGIKRHDIILAAGDRPLKEVADLVAVVDRSQGKKISLTIIRGGKQQKIELTPQKQPAEYAAKGPIDFPPDSKWHKLGQLFDQTRPGKDGRPPLRMRFMHPGMILPPLPPDMTVTMIRKGDQPPKFIVKRGDEKWTVTADELDKLPADIRPHVERMIGGTNIVLPRPPGMLFPGERLNMPDPAQIEKKLEQRIQKEMEAMNRQLKRLEKMAEDLRKGRTLPDESAEPQLKADKKAATEQKKDK